MNMKKEKEIPKHYDEAGFDDTFAELVREYRANREVMVGLEERNKELAKIIEPEMLVRDLDTVAVDDLIAVRCNGRTASVISSHRLLEKGVTLEQIDYATIAGTPYSYIQVRGRWKKGKGDDRE